MKRVASTAGLIILVLLAAFLLYDHFVADRIMDKGGMENPEYSDHCGDDDIQILDGDGTYVEDQALLGIIVGTWQSEDGSLTMTLGEDHSMILAQNGTVVLEGCFDFTYILPSDHQSVEFTLDEYILKNSDGTESGEITCLYCETDGISATMHMEISLNDGRSEAARLVKAG